MTASPLTQTLWRLALALALPACGDMADMAESGGWYDPSAGADAGSSDNGSDTAPPPPEDEVDFDLQTPEAGASLLYIPSTALDALLVVDARTLEVELVEVGLAPTLVRALPSDSGAVVLNEGSSDLSIVRRDPETGAFDVETRDVLAGSNRLVLSPDGAVAFTYFEADDGAAWGSLQDVSAVRLGAPGTINLSVGLRPSAIVFADEGRIAFVECEDGLSVIPLADLAEDTFLPPIPTSPDPFVAPLDREVAVSLDGTRAIVRDLAHEALFHVDLETGELASLPLPGYASDLDLTGDGALAIVPIRSPATLALIDIPEAFTWTAPEESPETPNPHVRYVDTSAPFGSTVLTADERQALLYSTQPGVLTIGMLDVAQGTVAIRPIPKALAQVIPSPDSTMAALIHRTDSGEGDLADHPAYALIDLASGYTKLIVTDHAVTTVTFTRDGGELFALLPDPSGQAHAIERVSTQTFAVRAYRVPDRPVYIGAMPTVSKVAVALDNPTGWLTFIDTATDEVLQLNSFELNAFIE